MKCNHKWGLGPCQGLYCRLCKLSQRELFQMEVGFAYRGYDPNLKMWGKPTGWFHVVFKDSDRDQMFLAYGDDPDPDNKREFSEDHSDYGFVWLDAFGQDKFVEFGGHWVTLDLSVKRKADYEFRRIT